MDIRKTFRLFFFIGVSWIWAPYICAGESAVYTKMGTQFIRDLNQILNTKYSNKSEKYSDPSKNGFTINVYKEENLVAVQDIINFAINEYYRNEQKIDIELNFYNQLHKDIINLGLFTKKPPFIQLILVGEK